MHLILNFEFSLKCFDHLLIQTLVNTNDNTDHFECMTKVKSVQDQLNEMTTGTS